jgi:hypothetical protein
VKSFVHQVPKGVKHLSLILKRVVNEWRGACPVV